METTSGVSMKEHFASLPDPRIPLKTRHNLVEVVVMALCAVIGGADNWVEVQHFARERLSWFKTFLALPNGIPSHDTFGRIFSLLDPDAFAQCFIHWIQDALRGGNSELVAIDGKTARRSHDHPNGRSALHVVSAWAVERGLILGQAKTDAKSNEIKAIPELLKTLDLCGTTVTIDAMGCQKEIVKEIAQQGGDYALCLKGNQGNLHRETALFFESGIEPDTPLDTFTTVDGDHGRIETRTYTITDSIDWFEDKSKWTNLRTIAKVESTRQVGDDTRPETRYFISSLPMDAKRFAWAARGHWGIESAPQAHGKEARK